MRTRAVTRVDIRYLPSGDPGCQTRLTADPVEECPVLRRRMRVRQWPGELRLIDTEHSPAVQ